MRRRMGTRTAPSPDEPRRRTPGPLLRRALACSLALAALGPGSGAAVAATGPHLRVRKDVADLTARERSNFVDAVLKLKGTPSPYSRHLNYYDQFVEWHRELYRCKPGQLEMMAHGGPMFLP